MTAASVAIVAVAAAWRLQIIKLVEYKPAIAYGIPAVIAIGGIWLAYRLVNYPPFANFLISVEAELDKVSWADWDYLKRATIVVLVVMFALGAYLFLADFVWQRLFGFIGFLDLDTID